MRFQITLILLVAIFGSSQAFLSRLLGGRQTPPPPPPSVGERFVGQIAKLPGFSLFSNTLQQHRILVEGLVDDSITFMPRIVQAKINMAGEAGVQIRDMGRRLEKLVGTVINVANNGITGTASSLIQQCFDFMPLVFTNAKGMMDADLRGLQGGFFPKTRAALFGYPKVILTDMANLLPNMGSLFSGLFSTMIKMGFGSGLAGLGSLGSLAGLGGSLGLGGLGSMGGSLGLGGLGSMGGSLGLGGSLGNALGGGLGNSLGGGLGNALGGGAGGLGGAVGNGVGGAVGNALGGGTLGNAAGRAAGNALGNALGNAAGNGGFQFRF